MTKKRAKQLNVGDRLSCPAVAHGQPRRNFATVTHTNSEGFVLQWDHDPRHTDNRDFDNPAHLQHLKVARLRK